MKKGATKNDLKKPKKTRQGNSRNTLLSSSSSNKRKKRSRGQGK
jgi:hypothetical protein